MARNEATKVSASQVAARLTELPPEDLRLVVDFLDYLKARRPASRGARLRIEARRRARLLQDVPREQLAVRFAELTEEVRREAIAKGTAVEGDWVGD
ncbi:MAG: hypothetical protein ACJ76J_21695 [Thermoanaerobaculia bacterium]